MSALQAAIMAGTIANKGKRMEPYLINRITDAQMNEIRATKPRQAKQAVTEDVANTIKEMMYSSEHSTFGYDGNSFASKTGTAEHGEGLPPHVWYVAFDPDRDIAVAVVVKTVAISASLPPAARFLPYRTRHPARIWRTVK